MCEGVSTVIPPRASALTSVFTSLVEIGSRPEVGSSSTSSSGLPTSADASATLRAMPLENPPTGRFATSSSPTIASSSRVRRAASRRGREQSPA